MAELESQRGRGMISKKRQHERAIKNASCYEEWCEAAIAYDKYNGHDKWRQEDKTSLYDYASVRRRLNQLQQLKADEDIVGLLYHLNEGIHGNISGIGKSALYNRALSGTKHLISDYIAEVAHALELIDQDDSGAISFQEKLDFFRRASHCFGRTALMFSGSGTLFYYHVGVAKALFKEGLLPNIISGSSGGSYVGSLICTHTDDELNDVLSPEFFMERLIDQAADLGLADGVKILKDSVPDLTFQQAFAKTGRSMNVTISPAEKHQTSRLLNAVASPSVLIRSGVLASCAVPGFFPSVTLEALDKFGKRKSYLPQRSWVDGAMSEDLPAKKLARMYGVNHTIVSQTNPVVIPMARQDEKAGTTFNLLLKGSHRANREWLNMSANLVEKSWLAPRVMVRMSSMLRSIINQEYTGDINIIAKHRYVNPFGILKQPDEKNLRKLFTMGERCAWPKIEMVRQQSRISRRLDSLLLEYESNSVETLHTRHMSAHDSG